MVVNDLLDIHLETNKRFPNIPKILLGHSMGSWIGLSALQQKNFLMRQCFLGQVTLIPSETFMQKAIA